MATRCTSDGWRNAAARCSNGLNTARRIDTTQWNQNEKLVELVETKESHVPQGAGFS
ncbi:hypothetical protein BN2476_300059 [Paraburkholderia piptadeniae]|uniref:Uncharacterized protein n=1 Tax=Paraburkholderia piptadeniae TaxID=1701573 RepID=A0A1N7S2C3_9BURK|nr:hypothetical protein BN2476_300059 [Paraburkholderia piptadeniae]